MIVNTVEIGEMVRQLSPGTASAQHTEYRIHYLWVTREVPVCGPSAFTVLKALAFGKRAENKDAYDLFYMWSGVGVPAVVESLSPLRLENYIDDALSVIERDFCRHDGPEPVGTARFLTQELDENVQADVVGYAQALLHSMGRL